MSKIITIPSGIEEIEKTKSLVDGFIIGIKDLCVNSNFNIEDLTILNSFNDKDIFINVNKNIHENELDKVSDILIKLNDYNIKGVLFYDIGVLNLFKKLNLKYDLVISQEHAITNSSTINYWHDNGVSYAHISSDITKEEVEKIIKNSKCKLMINLFGYLPMFVSRRHIVKNYLDCFELDMKSDIYYMEKENDIYPLIDSNIGTSVYSNNILNGIKYSLIDVDYIVLNSFNIDLDKFIKVINMFKSVNVDNVLEYDKIINNMFSNVDYGFLDRKTIYKVGHE